MFLCLTFFFIIFSSFHFFTNVHIHKLSVPDGCEKITDLLNGKLQEHNLSSGRALEFHCDRGYTLQGESIIMCVGNGSWSSPFPVCIRMSCTMISNTHLFIDLLMFLVHSQVFQKQTFFYVCKLGKTLPNRRFW